MKTLLKIIYYFLVRLIPSRGAIVLMYHSIGENDEFFTVFSADFEKQMSYLAKNDYKVLSISEIIKLLKNGQEISPRTIAITFDDGYEDNYHQAFPILKKYGFPAAIFLVTGSVGNRRTTSGGITFPMLNWQQIKEMDNSGLVEFFPHSHTHSKLDLLSRSNLEQEIRISKDVLENQLGKKMLVFAYPYGRSNQEVRDFLKQEGFSAAFTIETGRIFGKVDPLLIKRNSIDSKVTASMFKGIVKHGRI